MEKLTRLTPEDRDNLSAYLDGELDENSTRRIESILTSSSAARKDVDLLLRTYDLLDVLPRPTASREFLEKTVATAQLAEFRPPITQQRWYRLTTQGGVLMVWFLAFTVAATCGFALTNALLPQNDDLLYEQLPVIQNLDAYSEAQSVEFLRKLADDQQLVDEIRGESRP